MNGKSSLKSLLLALQFLTVITLVSDLRADREQLRSSLSFFPLIGLFLGSCLALFLWVFHPLFPATILSVMLVVLLAFLTRALHLDGLADTADAIGSGAPRERALEIMKDHCNGALGVVALVSVMLLKFASMLSLTEQFAWQWLIIVPAISRWGLNCLGAFTMYARNSVGLGSPFCGAETRITLFLAGLTVIVSSWFLCRWQGLALVAVVSVWSFLVARWTAVRFGGVTGDILGAHIEITEALCFMAAAVMVS